MSIEKGEQAATTAIDQAADTEWAALPATYRRYVITQLQHHIENMHDEIDRSPLGVGAEQRRCIRACQAAIKHLRRKTPLPRLPIADVFEQLEVLVMSSALFGKRIAVLGWPKIPSVPQLIGVFETAKLRLKEPGEFAPDLLERARELETLPKPLQTRIEKWLESRRKK